MKEFNLELAKQGYPVQTMDERPARIICFDRKHPKFPIVALVTFDDNHEENIAYTVNGSTTGNDSVTNMSLVMAPVKVTRWMNVYHGGSDYKFGSICQTKESALNAIDKAAGYISTAKIEWEE